MLNFFYALFIATCICSVSCQDSQQTKKLNAREEAVLQREQEFLIIEEDYKKLLKMRDSLHASSTIHTDSSVYASSWIDSLVGDWDGRLVCTSTTCKGYVIGDQRSERWNFLCDSSGYYLHVAGKGNAIKTYTVRFTENSHEVVLVEDATNRESQTLVTFGNLGSSPVRGQQRATKTDNCLLVFSVQLTPRKP